MLDDDPELEEAMAALPLEQLEANLLPQPNMPALSGTPADTNHVHPLSSAPLPLSASRPHGGPPPSSLPRPSAASVSTAFPRAASTVPACGSSFLAAAPSLPALLAEWRQLQAEWRGGSTALLNDPYEVCHAMVKQLLDDMDDEKMETATPTAANSSTIPTRAPSDSAKQLCSLYCELMALLDLPSSPFAPSTLSSLRSPPPYEPALLHHLACIAYNTALHTDNWSLAAYFCHCALQLFTLPDVSLPVDVPSCLSSLSLYLIALLDELAARETASVHATYGEAMLRVVNGRRSREGKGGSSGSDDALNAMLELQARMYVVSGRRQWAEEAAKRQKAEQKDSKKRKLKSLRKLSHARQWEQAVQNELDDVRQTLLSLLAQRTLPLVKCEQLLAVAFHLQLDELRRPLVEHLIRNSSASSPVGWLLHYVELLCMLSSNEELFVFTSSSLSSASFPPLHFRCWQYLCERCWTAGIVLVRGGPSEMGERLLAVAIRLLERACQCDVSERSGSQMNESKVLNQLNEVLAYVQERDRQHA